MKPNKQNIVNDILIELEKGIDYTNCLALCGTKWNLPKTTFVRYWNQANQQHKIKQDSIQKQLLTTSTEAQKERLKKAILTKDEILEKLSKIAKSAVYASKDGLSEDYTNRINAMKVINEMQGYKAATKVESESKINIANFDIKDVIKFNE